MGTGRPSVSFTEPGRKRRMQKPPPSPPTPPPLLLFFLSFCRGAAPAAPSTELPVSPRSLRAPGLEARSPEAGGAEPFSCLPSLTFPTGETEPGDKERTQTRSLVSHSHPPPFPFPFSIRGIAHIRVGMEISGLWTCWDKGTGEDSEGGLRVPPSPSSLCGMCFCRPPEMWGWGGREEELILGISCPGGKENLEEEGGWLTLETLRAFKNGENDWRKSGADQARKTDLSNPSTLFNAPILPEEWRFLHWTKNRPEIISFLLSETPWRLAPQIMSEAWNTVDLLWMSDIFLCKYFRQSRNSKPLLRLPNISHDKSLFSDAEICVWKSNKGKMFKLCLNPKSNIIKKKTNQPNNLLTTL